MTNLITQPQLLTAAATDASEIGSAINEAKAAAAGPTTSLAAAAEDEVSAVAAQLFGAYGQEYQALLQQAAAFHDQFVATLAAAGNAGEQNPCGHQCKVCPRSAQHHAGILLTP